jgi:hypothetical protein
MQQALIQCLNSPEIKQQLVNIAYDPEPASAEVLAMLLKNRYLIIGPILSK